jgi:outer membrane receptor for ferrienterochelin and colicins
MAGVARGASPTALAAALLLGWAGAASAQPAEPQTIVVTASRWALAVADAPASMSVVRQADIRDRGADTVLEALRGETGITLQGRTIGGRKVLSLRGLDSKHTLFLVDGRRIGASDGIIGHSDFQYDWIAMEDVERIEIVRGPLSVLYGSEALGGVVNIITRQVGDRWRTGALLEATRAEGGRGGDGERGTLRADGPLGGGFSLKAGAAKTRLQPVASTADPLLSELEGRDREEAWASLGWRGGAADRVDLDLRGGRDLREADARERGGRRRYHVTVNDIERSFASLGWESEWQVPWARAPLATQLRAYHSLIDVENRRTQGVAVNTPQRIEERVLEGQARAELGSGAAHAHALTTGFEVRNESLDDPGLPGGRSIAQHRALYVQDELRPLDTVGLTAGVRYDHHQLYGPQWSPRLYAVWRLGSGITVKGGYSHGFKAPNLKQIVPGGRAEGPNIFLGNPDLQPERSDNLEVGLSFTRADTQLHLVAFDQHVRDLIEIRFVSPGAVPGTGTYTYANLSRATLRGLEASVTQALGYGFSAALAYAYLDARSATGQRLERRPRHSASARLDWRRGPWRAGLNAETSSDQVLPSSTAGAPAVRLPDVTLLGAHLALALPHGLELAAGVSNLSNVRLADKSSLFTQVEAPRTWRLTLRGDW